MPAGGLRPLLVACTLIAGVATGCVTEPEEGTGPEEPQLEEMRLVWEDGFTVEEGTTAVDMELGVVRTDSDLESALFRVVNPDGDVVVERVLEWEDEEQDVDTQKVAVDVLLGEDERADAALTPGEWTYTVHARGPVDVDGFIRILPDDGEGEIEV